jgi:hypothetical protein
MLDAAICSRYEVLSKVCKRSKQTLPIRHVSTSTPRNVIHREFYCCCLIIRKDSSAVLPAYIVMVAKCFLGGMDSLYLLNVIRVNFVFKGLRKLFFESHSIFGSGTCSQITQPLLDTRNTVHRSRVDPLQGMRVLRQCKVPRAEVMFVVIQRENICPSKKEMNKAVAMLELPDVCS